MIQKIKNIRKELEELIDNDKYNQQLVHHMILILKLLNSYLKREKKNDKIIKNIFKRLIKPYDKVLFEINNFDINLSIEISMIFHFLNKKHDDIFQLEDILKSFNI